MPLERDKFQRFLARNAKTEFYDILNEIIVYANGWYKFEEIIHIKNDLTFEKLLACVAAYEFLKYVIHE